MASTHSVVTTDEQIDQAIARAATLRGELRAVDVAFIPSLDIFVVKLSNGERLVLQRESLEGLQSGTRRQLSHVEISQKGSALHWPDLDVDLHVPGLLRHVYGTKRWMSEIGKLGGSARSSAKREAARANGRSGGRPRKAAER